MFKIKKLFLASLLLLIASTTFLFNTAAQAAPDWPDLYDPFTLLTLNLELVNPDDLDTILNDTTYDIEVPAWFWADGEESEKILISVRRKSAEAIPNEMDPNKKVSFKLDINEFKDDPGGASIWHGVKKLSIENGDDMDVVTEGFAWYLHRLAAADPMLNYQSGLASWVNLNIDGQYMGVFVNVEQPDKQFLKNRGLWEGGDDTWLYKMSDIDSPDAKEAPEDEFGNVIDSPASEALCYTPFKGRDQCGMPIDFKEPLNSKVNMEGMLTLGAISAFQHSPDDLFSKGKNFYYLDYSEVVGLKREYMQWDLDSTFGSLDPSASMYNQAKGVHDDYEKSLVETGDAPFREEYNTIIEYLLNNQFNKGALISALQSFEVMLSYSLSIDPNSKDAAASFEPLAAYVSARTASMLNQLPPPPSEPDTIHVGDLDGGATSAAGRAWNATVTVTVHDYVHVGNASGATVSASWSSGVVGDTSCVTDMYGQCNINAGITDKLTKKVSLNITDVSGNYLSGANHDVDDDSDGTSITISRP